MAGFPAGLTIRRREQVARLWLHGYTERQISELVQAEALKPGSRLAGCEKTTHITIHKDIVWGREMWLADIKRDLGPQKAEQIAGLREVVHQAWVDYSNCTKTKTTITKDLAGNITTEIEHGTWHMRPGYLHIIISTYEKMAKICGTIAPQRFTGAEGEPLFPTRVELVFSGKKKITPPEGADEDFLEAIGEYGDGSHNN